MITLVGCTGVVTPPGGSEPGVSVISCDRDAEWTTAPLRRLSHEQLTRSLDAFVRDVVPNSADAVLAAEPVALAVTRLPADSRVTTVEGEHHGGFRRLAQQMEESNVRAVLEAATRIGEELSRTDERLEEMVGACATDADSSNDDMCVRDFIERVGATAHRRPLTQDDVDFYLRVYDAEGIEPAGVADVITVMLSGPYFLYHVEHGDEGASDEVVELTNPEIANRLAYHFWNEPPDPTLVDLVASDYDAAVEYATADPRAEVALASFVREWLSLEDLEEMDRNVGRADFDALRGDFEPTADTREHMIEEIVRMVQYYAARPDAGLAELFTSDRSFATHADLAEIYGVEPWSGSGEPPVLPDGRAGILTRAGLIASGSPTTRPVLKGLTVRTLLLCDSVGVIPDDAMAVAQEITTNLSPEMSTRERTTALTESQPSCASCHSSQINPLGFVTEGFDPLGRARTEEPVYDASGAQIARAPVNTTTDVVIGSRSHRVRDPNEVAALIVESGRAETCFARRYFRYTFGRHDDVAADGCAIMDTADAAREQSLGEGLRAVARTEQFTHRRFD